MTNETKKTDNIVGTIYIILNFLYWLILYGIAFCMVCAVFFGAVLVVCVLICAIFMWITTDRTLIGLLIEGIKGIIELYIDMICRII